MPTFTLFDEYIKYQLDGTIDLDSDSFFAILSNTTPDPAADSVYANFTEIAAGNGYTTKGVSLSSITLAETGAGTGIWLWSAADFSWTATGGAIATFQYVILLDDTPSSPLDPAVGFWDYGTALNITVGSTFNVDVSTNGILQSQEA